MLHSCSNTQFLLYNKNQQINAKFLEDNTYVLYL